MVDADTFVGMYVNEMTRDMGERGRRAIETLFDRLGAAGIVPRGAKVEPAP